MNRRTYLKQLMAASGGLIALPSWAGGWSPEDLTGLATFNTAESALLSSVADTIIPAGNEIGALSVGVDSFLQKLFQDCYDTQVQDNIKVQLKGLDDRAMTTYSKTFPACDQMQRQELLMKLSASEDKSEKDFFALVKSETIRGFRTSKEVLLNYLEYRQVPGHYYGCANLTA